MIDYVIRWVPLVGFFILSLLFFDGEVRLPDVGVGSFLLLFCVTSLWGMVLFVSGLFYRGGVFYRGVLRYVGGVLWGSVFGIWVLLLRFFVEDIFGLLDSVILGLVFYVMMSFVIGYERFIRGVRV